MRILITILALAAVLASAPAFAQTAESGGSTTTKTSFGLEAHGLYALQFSDDDLKTDDVFGGGGGIVIALGDNVKLDLGADYFKPKNEIDSSLKTQFIPVTGTLRLGGYIAEVVFIYVGGGAGWSFNDVDTTNLDDITLENCFTWHACGGLELFLSPQISLRGEFRYVWLRPDVKEEFTGEKEEVRFDHMQLRAGLGFYF
jgi:opacity protein-like surface antigen